MNQMCILFGKKHVVEAVTRLTLNNQNKLIDGQEIM